MGGEGCTMQPVKEISAATINSEQTKQHLGQAGSYPVSKKKIEIELAQT